MGLDVKVEVTVVVILEVSEEVIDVVPVVVDVEVSEVVIEVVPELVIVVV